MHFPIFPVSVYWSRVRIMITMHVLPIHFRPMTHIGEDTRYGSMWRVENNIGSDLRATLSLILPCPETRRPCRFEYLHSDPVRSIFDFPYDHFRLIFYFNTRTSKNFIIIIFLQLQLNVIECSLKYF